MNRKLTFLIIPFLALFCHEMAYSQSNLLKQPEGICYYAPWKAWFVTNAEGDNVVKIDSLWNQSLFWEGINIPIGIEAIGDSLYISSNEPYRITCLSIPDSSLMYFLPTTNVYAVGHMDYDSRLCHLYITDQHGGVMRVNVFNRKYQVFVPTGTGLADGSQTVIADTTLNRLYVFAWPLAFVRSVSMTDSTDIVNLFNPGYSKFIGSATDEAGNIYVSSWSTNKVYKYPPHLQGEAVIFSANHDQPAGMAYNPAEGVIAVCNFGNNTIDFISVTTGIETHPASFILEKVSTYPNPILSTVTLSYQLNATANIEVTVFDQMGNIRFSTTSQSIRPGEHIEKLSLGNLPAGIYLMTIKVNQQIFHTQKLIRISM